MKIYSTWGVQTVCRRARRNDMRLFLLVLLLALYSNWVSAADLDPMCGDPPAVTNEKVKGELEIKANAISKVLGALGFGAAYENSREDIFGKYGDANAARADQHLYFLVCNIVVRSTTLTDQQKIETIFKMRSMMSKAPAPTPTPRPGPQPQAEPPLSTPPPRVERPPPPYSPPEPQSDVVQVDGATVAAEEFVRLTSSNLSSQVNISGRIKFPFCTSLGILRNERDLRQFLGVDTVTLSQIGRIIVTARDIMRLREYTILKTMSRPDNFRRDNTSAWCKEQRVIFDNDYVVGILRQHLDVQQAFLFDVVIDWQSGLVKGVIQ